MLHDHDAGYTRRTFATLVDEYPGEDVYPPADFRVEWGPIFHRGRLDNTARVLCIGQDPGPHEAVARRILVGEAGQRVQGFLAKLGIVRRYVMVNAFLYSVFGQGGGERHRDDAAIAQYRDRWLDALLVGSRVKAVVAFGGLAQHAFETWKETPTGQQVDVAFRAVRHPTYPESASRSGQRTREEAMKETLHGWNDALEAFRPIVRAETARQPLYADDLTDGDLAPIPEADLPPGVPAWMRSLDAWAARRGDTVEDKRATLVVTVPRRQRPWTPLTEPDE
jgi:hypothetical protein